MIHRVRFWQPARLLALVALLVAAVALYVGPLGPRGTQDTQEVIATPTEVSLCNVSVKNIPADVVAAPYLLPNPDGATIYLAISIPLPNRQKLVVDPQTGQNVPNEARVIVDPETGDIVFEDYRGRPADEGKLKAVLSTLKVGPLDPGVSAWPRTATQPQGKKIQVRDFFLKNRIKYRQPEDGSGMLVRTWGSSSPDEPDRLEVRTCRSMMMLDGNTGSVLDESKVVPGEKDMYQRFLSEVEP